MTDLLTHGNGKLGEDLIWSFSVPSGRPELCRGMTPTCREHCYARRLESFRPSLVRRLERNLAASRKPDFVAAVVACLARRFVRVLRWHVSGDVYSARYARKIRRVARLTPHVQHFLYTRGWRVPAIRAELEQLAAAKNVRVWYSCDKDTGLPEEPVHPRVRLAYMQVAADDFPPGGTRLVFRVRRLRKLRNTKVGGVPVCPVETPQGKKRGVSCQQCQLCMARLEGDRPGVWKNGRFALGVTPW